MGTTYKRLSMANPIKKEEILRISPDDFRPNNSRIFFPITNDTTKDERINPIRRTNKPKADTGIPTTVIADSTITTTNNMIKRNPTTVFFIIDFFITNRTESNCLGSNLTSMIPKIP
ncbi:MAG TPA: hypothetical protein VFV86_06930, partial [Nitrososphaeraceae archaeon]|nr:hypothetical protein [Nitrososphaeraceae archaeon]